MKASPPHLEEEPHARVRTRHLARPAPAHIDLIFSPQDKARLEKLGRVIWHEGSPAPEALIEQHLPDAMAIIGQTPLPRERLDRAPACG